MLHLKRYPALLALVLMIGPVLAACQPATLAPLATPSAPGIGIGITADLCPNLIVQPGIQVAWTNQDSREHIVRHRPEDADPRFDSGTLQPGDSFTFTFLEAGSYPYECSADGAMLGTVTVEP